ncbi:hypothetical protein QTG54_005201 [Skeletonema marinoi]|uniref:Uncharacterized protein n=1 Tax=Skeletonema marinoi TaxID=267567 RepID=A0AAD8YBW1_9STRA|nr:hypothetical protein QTG54_005201 [Skeletonema marinoi]
MENDRNAVNRRLQLEGIQDIRIDVTNANKEKQHDATNLPDPSLSSSELPSKTKSRPIKAVKKKVEAEEEATYVPRWNSSSAKPIADADGSDESSVVEQFPTQSTDELPHFADEESIALHNEIKLLEQRRDDAARLAKSHRERADITNDHLQSIRQEIDHTNSLVAAKKNEVDTEDHLVSLSEREVGQCSRDCSKLDDDIETKQKTIKRAQNEIAVAEDELEKLRTDLNWNQEELEQWAKAATKKEEENLAMQKYTLVDDLKIKELALVIEDLTKLSVEKKSMLENEVTETRSNQTELDKLAERISVKEHRERYEKLQHEKDASEKDISNRERSLRTKRQELSSLQAKERSLSDEINSLKSENTILAATVESKREKEKRALDGLEQAQVHVEVLSNQLEQVRNDLSSEKDGATSKERVVEEIEVLLATRERELGQAEKKMISLKQKVYKDSQKLSDLRQQEADLIAEVKGTQANIKNYASKINLEKELELENQKKTELLQQQRKLTVELRSWNKKHDNAQLKCDETTQKIDYIGLEYLPSVIKEKKEEALGMNEVKRSELRTSKDDHHKAAIDLGKVRLLLNKTRSKYETMTKSEGNYESPEFKLILAAQRREELQQEGDQLDETIMRKEEEVRKLQLTLEELKKSTKRKQSRKIDL